MFAKRTECGQDGILPHGIVSVDDDFVLLFIEQNGLELPLDALALVALARLLLLLLVLRAVVCTFLVEELTEWLLVHFDAPAHWLRRNEVLRVLFGRRPCFLNLFLGLRHA